MDNISMVFQRVYLFQDTVYNNIALGRPDASREEIIEAAKKARCYDFIMELPDGFDTVIGEGGASLSGGQAQRLSIARCILKDSPIVILDEATASVDADNESYIQQAISELCKGKTLLVIAHRLNSHIRRRCVLRTLRSSASQRRSQSDSYDYLRRGLQICAGLHDGVVYGAHYIRQRIHYCNGADAYALFYYDPYDGHVSVFPDT
jgi:ATP-binding cassette subfamily B protein